MLALPRIAAVPGGTGAVGRTSSGKSAGPANNPFIKLLAGLDSVKAERASNAKAASSRTTASLTAAKPANGATSLAARQGSAADPGSRSARAGNVIAAPARNAGSMAAPGISSPSGFAAEADAKALAGIPSNGAKIDARQAKIKNGDSSAERADASLLAGSSVAAAAAVRNQPAGFAQGGASAGARNENGNPGLEALGSRTEKGRDGARVTVVDMRLKAARESAAGKGNGSDAAAGEASRDALKSEPARVEADQGFQGRLASGMSAEADSPAQVAKDAPAPAGSFTETLASRLRDGAADIVRSAQVVLRDGDAGIIRLRLEPESLGGVKIELKMAEKQISGKIVVESDIAGEAFRSSLDALRDAFAESGFETASLEVEVRNGMASGSGGDGNGTGGDDGPYWSRSLRELDAAVPALASAGRDGLVDMTM